MGPLDGTCCFCYFGSPVVLLCCWTKLGHVAEACCGVFVASDIVRLSQSLYTIVLLETEGGAIEQLQLAPVFPAALFYGKALANTMQLLLVMMVMLPPLIALCDVWFIEGFGLFVIPWCWGLLACLPGAMYAAMTARLSNRQLLLPLLLFPLIVPALLSAVKATSLVFFGDPMGQIGSWLTLLGAFDVIYWILCGIVFGRIVES